MVLYQLKLIMYPTRGFICLVSRAYGAPPNKACSLNPKGLLSGLRVLSYSILGFLL